MDRHIGRLEMASELILKWLDFADGGKILDAKYDMEKDTISLLIEHPDMPIKEDGMYAEPVRPIYETITDALGHSVTIRKRKYM